MPRTLWKGAISFGLVHIPVGLYPASREDDIDFDWLDKRTMDPVGYKRVNKRTGKEITKEHIVKGVAHGPHQYVVLSDDEIERLGEPQRAFVDRYGYPHTTKPGLTILELDNGRFMNHTPEPNTDFRNPAAGYAIRDIAEGEEITCDYEQFAPGTEMLPGRQFVANGSGLAAA